LSELITIFPQQKGIRPCDNGVCLDLWVHEDIDYFKGHFPQQPIVAGVVQLDWAVHYAAKHLPLVSCNVLRVEVLKFQVIIPANIALTLTLEHKSDAKFLFKFESHLGLHSSGRVILDET
jgi:3-hydroxymyristoyl/3-hydroxydecanoyl-(acyl carrier protein) dehydratase